MFEMNKQETIMRQLVQQVEKICEENNITVFMSVSIEEKDGEDGIYQTSSHFACGRKGSIRRLIETTICQSGEFRQVILDVFDKLKRKHVPSGDTTLN